MSHLALINLKVENDQNHEKIIFPLFLGQAKRITNERQMIAKLERTELEDRYVRLYDNELILKKHAQKQEEKIKK